MPGPQQTNRPSLSPSRPWALFTSLVLSLAFFTFPGGEGNALSFPFRTFASGDPVPAAAFSEYSSNQTLSFADLKGEDFLAVFWGADLPEKKEHSILILKQIQEQAHFFQERNIRVLSINIQGDSSETIADVLRQSGGSGPVFIDPGRESYGSLGIYVMPTLLLVDKTGTTIAGQGYSHNSVDRLKGEIEILRGEKNRDQVEEELQPSNREIPLQQKQADSHLNFGRIMEKKGRINSAIREFEQALALVPELPSALIELGCLYQKAGNTAQAEETINKALALAPGSLRARICAAQLMSRLGKTAQAKNALERLLAENPHLAEIPYQLGKLHEDQGQAEQASQYYRRAYEVLQAERSAAE